MGIVAEEWRPVVGFESSYEVSSLGCVRSFDRVVVRGNGRPQFHCGRPIKPRRNRCGYYRVGLSKDGKQRRCSVHAIVAAAFIGPRPDGYDINHKDGVKRNNAVENLEYVTPSRNQKHAYEKQLKVPVRGSWNGQAKLSEESVMTIKSELRCGVTGASLARRFKVSERCIHKIKKAENWAHVE